MVAMDDFWKGMEFDKQSIERIEKSVLISDSKPGMSVLDVGCYKMTIKRYLPKGIRYIGLDSTRYKKDVVVKDLEKSFYFKEKFDRIFCLEVLEHLKLPGNSIKSIYESLKDDGIAVISLPNEATLYHRIRSLFGKVDGGCFSEQGKHLHLPSLKQCKEFLRSKRFFVDGIYYYIVLPIKLQKIKLLTLILRLLSNYFPSLFARGFIFKLRKVT